LATTDHVTPVNLSQHAYFNLDGAADIRHHTLQVFASEYTPAGDDLIPTGKITSVQATPFDFRIGKSLKFNSERFDCNFVLDNSNGRAIERKAALLKSTQSGLSMLALTTKPGLQFYDGHLLSVNGLGKAGASYGANAGLCLETQFFPDSPNQIQFPDCFLTPNHLYHHITRLIFSEDNS
jgi:aldose 1-epimerase